MMREHGGIEFMRVRSLIAAAGLVAFSACSLFDNGPRDSFLLTHIADQPLPAVVRSIVVDYVHQVDYRVTWGSLTLYDHSRFAIDSRLEEVWDGTTIKQTWQGPPSRGTYERSDTAITIRFKDNEGINRVFTYRLVDGGQRLRGEQWGLIAQYLRQ
jgi:hypothetical protein